MSEPTRRIGIPHLPALDGLRGLAVLGVLLFHDDRLVGGYLGVDLFFVLSGYLITSLLLAEWAATGRIDLKEFWIRRARRLFPALLALLVAVSLFSLLFAAPGERARIRGDALATLGYVANWHAIFGGKSYWDLFTAPSPLEHTWSLAIEEQFYVLWPLFVFLLLRVARGSARALFAGAAGLSALSCAAMWLLYTPETASRVYMGTDTRGASILVGAALACVLASRKAPLVGGAARALDAAGVVAVAGLGLAWARLEGQSPLLYRGGFWLTEAAVLVLIGCAAQGKDSLVARVLALRPFAALGLVSYGVYLWHWPLYCILSRERLGFGGLGLSALRLVATFAVTIASYLWLEQPIRRRGLPWGRPLVVVPAVTLFVVLAIILSTRGEAAPPPQVRAAAELRAAPTPSEEKEGSIRILVEGDSVAEALGERLHFVRKGTGASVVDRGIGDCSLLEGVVPAMSLNGRAHDGGNCAAKWAADADELRPAVTLVVLGGGFFAKGKVKNKWERACDAGWRKAFAGELASRLESLRPSGGRVWVTLVPYPVGIWDKANPRSLVDCLNDTMKEVALASPGVSLLDLQSKLCPEGHCAMESGGAPIRPDGMHFDGAGSEEISRWVLGELLRGVPSP